MAVPLLVAYWTDTSALELPSAFDLDRRRPLPTNSTANCIVGNWTLTGCAERSRANSDVSPVNSIGRRGAHPRVRGNAVLRRERDDGHARSHRW